MSAYEAAKFYNAIKLHFNNETYNAIKYNYKTRVKMIPENQLYSFQKLYKAYKDDIINFYVSNFLETPKASVFDLCSTQADETYRLWKKRSESITYIFKNEVQDLLRENSLNEILQAKKSYPILLMKTLQEESSIDTLLILDSMLQFFDVWDKNIGNDFIWKNFRLKCDKYRCFINIDVDKFKKILRKEVKCVS